MRAPTSRIDHPVQELRSLERQERDAERLVAVTGIGIGRDGTNPQLVRPKRERFPEAPRVNKVSREEDFAGGRL
jgi:hypothetical protein